MENNLKEKKVWNGEYNGVVFEINNFKIGDRIDQWTFYLYIHLIRLPESANPQSFWLHGEKDEKGRVFYKYYTHPILNGIKWHYGITYYEKCHGFDGAQKVIKVGCDYAHAWDEGYTYFLQDVLADVKDAIDSFREMVPDYKYWCQGNGNLYSKQDGVIRNDRFHSKEYWGKEHPEWFEKM